MQAVVWSRLMLETSPQVGYGQRAFHSGVWELCENRWPKQTRRKSGAPGRWKAVLGQFLFTAFAYSPLNPPAPPPVQINAPRSHFLLGRVGGIPQQLSKLAASAQLGPAPAAPGESWEPLVYRTPSYSS